VSKSPFGSSQTQLHSQSSLMLELAALQNCSPQKRFCLRYPDFLQNCKKLTSPGCQPRLEIPISCRWHSGDTNEVQEDKNLVHRKTVHGSETSGCAAMWEVTRSDFKKITSFFKFKVMHRKHKTYLVYVNGFSQRWPVRVHVRMDI
jgi:hypothetical protein